MTLALVGVTKIRTRPRVERAKTTTSARSGTAKTSTGTGGATAARAASAKLPTAIGSWTSERWMIRRTSAPSIGVSAGGASGPRNFFQLKAFVPIGREAAGGGNLER